MPWPAMDDDAILDLRGLKCPLPALMAKKALAAAAPGMVLTVLADDPLAAVDIPHMCHGEGHTVEDTGARADAHAFRIRRGPAAAADRPPAPGD